MNDLFFGRADDGMPMPVLVSAKSINFLVAPTGVATAFPAGTRFVEIVAVTGDAWLRFGGNAVAVASIPTANIVDGSAPRVVPSSTSLVVALRATDTHYAIRSAGNVSIAFWG